ncbi:hypothetical protein VB735_28440 [Halotia wernerae UHCC 0503]|nr:hypothetical protein [Halotia wernerae UHCC 0503]
MKSTQRPSKPPQQQPKTNDPTPKPELVAYKPVEKQQLTSQPDPTPSEKTPALAIPSETLGTNTTDKSLPQKKSKTHARDQRSDSAPQSKQHQHTPQDDEEELPPQNCQHVQFLDCDKAVGRVVFECWHCHSGIISEFTGEPTMGEYKGRPSVIQVNIQCPNCEKTAIRLTTGEVLSTTAIPSPWKQ